MKVYQNSRREILKIIATAIVVSLLALNLFNFEGFLGDILSFLGIAVIVSSVLYVIEVVTLRVLMDEKSLAKKSLLTAYEFRFKEVKFVDIKSGGLGPIITSSTVLFKLMDKEYHLNLSYIEPRQRSEIIEIILDRCR